MENYSDGYVRGFWMVGAELLSKPADMGAASIRCVRIAW